MSLPFMLSNLSGRPPEVAPVGIPAQAILPLLGTPRGGWGVLAAILKLGVIWHIYPLVNLHNYGTWPMEIVFFFPLNVLLLSIAACKRLPGGIFWRVTKIQWVYFYLCILRISTETRRFILSFNIHWDLLSYQINGRYRRKTSIDLPSSVLTCYFRAVGNSHN